MLHVQKHLLSTNDPRSMEQFHVNHRRHGRYPNLVLFKYGIKAPFVEPIVQECRGIVLDESDGWKVVSRGFDKFFNHGEGHAARIDWSTARVQEKLDGSLAVMYHYAGEWHVATSGSPDASGVVQRAGDRTAGAFGDRTFAQYFWETFEAEGGTLPPAGCEDACFVFELMGPLNRVIVVHEKPWLRLLSVRDRVTGAEHDPERGCQHVNIQPVRSFPLGSFEEITKSFEHISPVSQEGYVVVDGKGRRVKVKHPGYVALHHMKDGMGPKAFVRIAQSGEVPEVLASFPEFAPLLEDMRRRYASLCEAVDATYARIKDIASQKDFALEATKMPYSATLFFMRRMGGSADEVLRHVQAEKLLELMGVEDSEPPAAEDE